MTWSQLQFVNCQHVAQFLSHFTVLTSNLLDRAKLFKIKLSVSTYAILFKDLLIVWYLEY